MTNVKASRVDPTQLVMPPENAPVIKVSKEMGSGVTVGVISLREEGISF